MKRSATILIVVLAVAAVGLVFLLADGQAQMGRGMMGPGYGYGMGPGMMGRGEYGGEPQYCPYCGSYLGPYGMGPGMMGPGYGYGMGPGMMGRGYGYGYGMGPDMMHGGRGYRQLEKPLGKKDAKEMLENYVQSLYNPELKVGKITEEDTYFAGEILTKQDVLVDTIIVDKNTGWMSSAMRGRGGGYGYGMGPGMMGRGYQGPQEPLKEKDVKILLDNYVQSTRNPNLKVGKITEKDAYFEGEILTKNNALVDKVLVDKDTGWMRSIYQ